MFLPMPLQPESGQVSGLFPPHMGISRFEPKTAIILHLQIILIEPFKYSPKALSAQTPSIASLTSTTIIAASC